MIQISENGVEAMKSIGGVCIGRMFLVYLANNGRLTESARVLRIGHEKLNNVLSSYNANTGKQRYRHQGALVQPDVIHDIAKEWAKLKSDCSETQQLVEQYKEAMQIGTAARESMQGKRYPGGFEDAHRHEEPTIFLEPKDGPPWYSFVGVY